MVSEVCSRNNTPRGVFGKGWNYRFLKDCSNLMMKINCILEVPNALQQHSYIVQSSKPARCHTWGGGLEAKSNYCRAKTMGWPGTTSKAVEKSDTPLPARLLWGMVNRKGS